MAEMRMIVDTALSEVPVNLMPLINDTDFKSRETSVAYNAAGMDLVWNFVTTGGAMTQTAVTPTTGGDYDWASQGDGMYSIEIPASGGASINNDTEGYGWFTGVATGVLPWRGPVIEFLPANVVNSLVNGSDMLQVDAREWLGGTIATPTNTGVPEVDLTHAGGTPITAGVPDVNIVQWDGDTQTVADAKDFFDNAYDPSTNKVEGVKLADATTTLTGHTPQTGDTYGALTGAQSEPTGVPAANETPLQKIGRIFMMLRNKKTVTETKKTYFDDSDNAEFEADISDDGTTYTESELNSI